jgi:hypothetical protein
VSGLTLTSHLDTLGILPIPRTGSVTAAAK